MKIKNCLVILAGSVVVLTSSGRIHAQSQLSFDGYAASPRLRQMMEDRNTMWAAMGGSEVVAEGTMRGNTSVGAPRAQQIIVAPATHHEAEWVGYRVTGADGIAASPRLRQMMNDRTPLPTAMGGSESVAGERTTAMAAPHRESPDLGSYKVTGDDGIAASPRLRQMMNDRSTTSEVAVNR